MSERIRTVNDMQIHEGGYIPSGALCIDQHGKVWVNKHTQVHGEMKHRFMIHVRRVGGGVVATVNSSHEYDQRFFSPQNYKDYLPAAVR